MLYRPLDLGHLDLTVRAVRSAYFDDLLVGAVDGVIAGWALPSPRATAVAALARIDVVFCIHGFISFGSSVRNISGAISQSFFGVQCRSRSIARPIEPRTFCNSARLK